MNKISISNFEKYKNELENKFFKSQRKYRDRVLIIKCCSVLLIMIILISLILFKNNYLVQQ